MTGDFAVLPDGSHFHRNGVCSPECQETDATLRYVAGDLERAAYVAIIVAVHAERSRRLADASGKQYRCHCLACTEARIRTTPGGAR
jgi:hypothetical protein